jgi:superfamily I DNA/RNA helicase
MGSDLHLSSEQQAVARFDSATSLFLSGPAGSGKTTAGVARLQALLQSGIAGENILILLPQRSLGIPYRQLLDSAQFFGSNVDLLTLGGLAQRSIALFWPMLGKNAGFKNPTQPPQFLTLETAQYYLAQIISPLFEKGYFESLVIDPNRIFSQVLDNLNKSAVVGFPADEIAGRLKSAWIGKPDRLIIYDQVQECALQFRHFCLEHNLLDYSLQFEIFHRRLWPAALCREYLTHQYQHLIYDNVEEDVPVTHDLLLDWLPSFASALVIQDQDSGFRTFMGADPGSAQRFSATCQQHTEFKTSLVQPAAINLFQQQLKQAIYQHEAQPTQNARIVDSFTIQSFHFYPQALDWLAEEISRLIQSEGIDPGQIVVLTPFLSDSLRFALSQRFQQAGIPFFTFRPSRSLRDEPAAKAMLTLAKLAFPGWNLTPSRHELRYALMQVLPGCDLIRADLLAQILYLPNRKENPLNSFAQIRPEMQERITFTIGNRFDQLIQWLTAAGQDQAELDIFLSRLFGELLSQPGFAFHEDYLTASIVNRLIESARKFRQATSGLSKLTPAETSREFVTMIEQGVIAAQYLEPWQEQDTRQSVLIAPAFTFLMSNSPAAYQFWLDIGSSGWWARLDQPLTQPYVLSRNWPSEQKWTAANEIETNEQTLARVVGGLLSRCSQHVDLLSIGMNESGNEERGALLIAMQTVLRSISAGKETANV